MSSKRQSLGPLIEFSAIVSGSNLTTAATTRGKTVTANFAITVQNT